MASTYSDLKIELIGTGDQSGTWGTTTNANLGTALEEAIVGRATATFASDADLTLTLTNSNATQVARNLVLNVTSGVSLTATRDLIVPAIEKPYIIQNNTTGAQSIRVIVAGTGVTVPNGKTAIVYNNGTDVTTAIDFIPSLTLGAALPVASGGTGATTSTGSGAVVLATSPTLVTPVLGVATATSVNKVAVTAPATSATLTIADGKTLTASNSLTLAGTDATTMTFPATSTTVAGLGIVQAFSVSQRGTVTTDNDGSFDMNATNNFLCTPTGGFTLTFTNITAGQAGNIILVNGSNYAIAAAATVKVSATALAAISATGTYWLSYFTVQTEPMCMWLTRRLSHEHHKRRWCSSWSGAAAGGYQIERSLRFNSADSAYLNRTPASASNRKTWTWSFGLNDAWCRASSFFKGTMVGTVTKH
jgi:hypothetical protein